MRPGSLLGSSDGVGPSRGAQFRASLRKNFIILTRSRGASWLRLRGWIALFIQVLMPVLFFVIMAIPKHYVEPRVLPEQLSTLYPLDDSGWGMVPSGGFSKRHVQIGVAPATALVNDTAFLMARYAACPTDASRSAYPSTSFFRYFSQSSLPPECQTPSKCRGTPDCSAGLVGSRLLLFPSASDALRHTLERPGSLDAVVDLTQAGEAVERWRREGGDLGPLRYGIHMNHTELPPTRLRYGIFDLTPAEHYARYWFFSNLQTMVDAALIGEVTGNDARSLAGLPRLAPSVKAFPWPAHTLDLGATAAALFFNLLLVYAFLSPTRSAVVAIVHEKELMLRDALRLVGLDDAMYWGSWTVAQLSTMLFSGLLCAILATQSFVHSSFGVLLLFLWLTSAALLAFAFCISSFFKTARFAGTASVFFYVVAMLPGYLAPSWEPYGGALWALACLLPPSAISLFAHVLLQQESVGSGVTWRNLGEGVAVEGYFSGGVVLFMLLLDVAVFALLTWYFDQIWPSGTGVQARPWSFPLFPPPAPPPEPENLADDPFAELDVDAGAAGAARRGPSAISIRQLGKDYACAGGGLVRALDRVSAELEAGRVTGVLGPNGAGKTTLLSVLMGLQRPTRGTAIVAGASVGSDPAALRGRLGVCAQQDALWPLLTVREHVALFAAIKGVGREAQEACLHRASRALGLGTKLDSAVEELSGGQRRMLSLLLAFLGNPAVVVLDEPTAGMDPAARHAAWDLLRACRAPATSILLATHSMEEADALADRVLILARGRVAARGTPLALKARGGAGCALCCRLRQREGRAEAQDALLGLVRAVCPGARMALAAGEARFALPGECSERLPDLLRRLEDRQAELGVVSYGLGMNTLESVFLSVAERAGREAGAAVDAAGPSAPLERAPPAPRREAWSQFKTVFEKRATILQRDRRGTLLQVGVPILVVFLALWSGYSTLDSLQQPALALDARTALGSAPITVALAPGLNESADVEALLGRVPGVALRRSEASSVLVHPYVEPANGTLDEDLLEHWFESPRTYGALFLASCPKPFRVRMEELAYAVLVNQSAVHALPAMLAVVHSAVLGWMTDGPAARLVPTNAPYPTLASETPAATLESAALLFVILCLTLSMALLSASHALLHVGERASGLHDLTLMASGRPTTVFAANFVADCGVHLATSLGVVFCFSLVPAFSLTWLQLAAIGGLLLPFGLAAVCLTHLLQSMFHEEMRAFQSLTSAYFFISFLGYVVIRVLQVVLNLLELPSIQRFHDICNVVLQLTSPHFNLAMGVTNVLSASNGGEPGPAAPRASLSFEDVGLPALWMLLQGLVFALLLVLQQHSVGPAVLRGCVKVAVSVRGLFRLNPPPPEQLPSHSGSPLAPSEPLLMRSPSPSRRPSDDDPDVAAERSSVRIQGANEYALECRGLRKAYGCGGARVEAVRSLWLGISRGECFGLVGTNGAGKTTTFRMLAGEEKPDAGSVLVDDRALPRQPTRARRQLGYCPQASAVSPFLTGQELVTHFGVLRGLEESAAVSAAWDLLVQLGLDEAARRPCGTYSGGMLRRLSVALALVGGPSVVLLDEPSTGMDPKARQQLWRVIQRCMARGQTVLLSSHNMEECESVCTRVGIMVDGALRCLGTVSHLESKFAAGYTVDLEAPNEVLETLKSKLLEECPSLELRLARAEHLVFQLSHPEKGSMPRLLSALELLRSEGLREYSVNQATLEQIFMRVVDRETLGADL